MGNNRRGGRRVSAARRRRQRQLAKRTLAVLTGGVLCLAVFLFSGKESEKPIEKKTPASESVKLNAKTSKADDEWVGAPDIDIQLLDVNEYSRPGTELKEIKGIVMHYVGNPGTSAQANRNYFQELKDAHITKASSHFVVGLEGEIIQCVPSTEISYASNSRNKDTLAIECCHPDETGKFNEKTYQSMVDLAGWLCARFDLNSQDVIRHYDVTGKLCPKYFVDNEDAWQQFKADVETKIAEIEKMKQ